MIIENGNWIVYVHICKITNKPYVGVTSEKNPARRWGKGGKNYKGCIKFWYAIQKYGWNNFEHEIIAKNLTKDEASNMEQLLIKKLDSITNGYNTEPGGINQGPRSLEARQKIKEARARQVFTPEQIKKATDAHIGMHHSKETKQLMRISMRKAKGRKIMCIETGNIYNCVSDASDATGYSVGRIWASASRYSENIKQRNRGYHWKFIQ